MNQDLVLGSFIYEVILLLVNKFVGSKTSFLLSITLSLILINLYPIYIVKKLYNKSKNKKLLVILALLLICTLNYLIFYPIDDELTVKSALIYCSLLPIILCIIFPDSFPGVTFLTYILIITYYFFIVPSFLSLILYLFYFVLLFITVNSENNVKIFSIGGILLTALLFLSYLYNLKLFNEKNLSLVTQLLIITLICFNIVWLLAAFGESITNKLTEIFGITSLSQFLRIFGIITLLIILSFNFQIYNDKPIASPEYYNPYELPFTPKDNEYISVEEMHDSFAANYIRAAYFETHPIEAMYKAMYTTPRTTLATSKQSIDEALEKAEKHFENAYKIAIEGFKENLPSSTEIAVETVSPKVSNILDVVGGIKTAYTIYAVSQEIQKANDILLNAMKDSYSSQDNTFSSSGITYKKEMPTREEVEAMFRNIRNNLAAEYDIMLRYINKFRDTPYTESIQYYRGVFFLDYLTLEIPPPTDLKRPKLYINLTHHDYEKYREMREFARSQKLALHEYERRINKLYMANLAILMFMPNDRALLEEIGKDCAELIWVIDTLADEKPELKKVGENWIYMDDPFDIAKVEKILSYYNTSNDFIKDYNIKFNRIKSKLNKLENNPIYFTISSLKIG